MRTVYALLVGIDDYPDKPLSGCINDVAEAESWLRQQGGPDPEILLLRDKEATRAAVVDRIRTHLGRSGPGDTALLWFSGHGSEHASDDPRAATGRSQALVCADSLDAGGQPLLQDTELGALLDEIAARGAHVVAVLDCCHSGGASRKLPPGARSRGVAWQPWWRKDGAGASRGAGAQGAEPRRHVLLAACREQEVAYEALVDGESRGYFSHSLVHALRRLGPAATYGKVHALAEERVRGRHHAQHPELRGPEHLRFLYGGALTVSPFLLRHTVSGWEVNCGHVHGLRSAGAEFTLVEEDGARRADAPRTVVVREVRPESALVEPVGWTPGRDDLTTVYGVTPSAMAFPPAAVTVVGDPVAVGMMTAAVDGAPMLSSGGSGLPLRLEVGGGSARVTGGDGHPVGPLPLRSPDDAARVADCLSHIARWHQLKDLTNPDPWLSSLVRVTVEPLVGDLWHSATGEVVCAYTRDGREPQVMVRVHNDSPHMLWCVLLDLADDYESSPGLFEGDFVAPGHAGTARYGEPVWLRLPPGRFLVRGSFARDWLKLIVAENEWNVAPFRLPAWSPDAPGTGRGGVAPGDGDGLLRFAPPPGARSAGGPARDVGRWGTVSVPVRTVLP
ncbi:caspase family protein [Streptomyces sp. NBC_01591]|uniref:caspase family protein n=1 Tax=Streptomyces sp. NBC_01591 TaxID=2975888 RepID=UPI002DD9D44D|nr:caspase family protein [Streptomyces sp. NBC_01591]WSD71012.1 caspase family protein [Streptomyces sp. NBC_01591]